MCLPASRLPADARQTFETIWPRPEFVNPERNNFQLERRKPIDRRRAFLTTTIGIGRESTEMKVQRCDLLL